jgi:hypothetical protein
MRITRDGTVFTNTWLSGCDVGIAETDRARFPKWSQGFRIGAPGGVLHSYPGVLLSPFQSGSIRRLVRGRFWIPRLWRRSALSICRFGTKQASELTRFWVDACQVCTLLQIALPTSERKIIQLRQATVLFSKNMLDMKGTLRGSLQNQTVFAAICARRRTCTASSVTNYAAMPASP